MPEYLHGDRLFLLSSCELSMLQCGLGTSAGLLMLPQCSSIRRCQSHPSLSSWWRDDRSWWRKEVVKRRMGSQELWLSEVFPGNESPIWASRVILEFGLSWLGRFSTSIEAAVWREVNRTPFLHNGRAGVWVSISSHTDWEWWADDVSAPMEVDPLPLALRLALDLPP